MGISTQNCFRGQSILAFANDSQSNNAPLDASCNGGDLATTQTDEACRSSDGAVGGRGGAMSG